MSEGASALQLVLGGDPALYAIVALSLYVSLSRRRARRDRGAAVRRAARADAISRAAPSSSS